MDRLDRLLARDHAGVGDKGRTIDAPARTAPPARGRAPARHEFEPGSVRSVRARPLRARTQRAGAATCRSTDTLTGFRPRSRTSPRRTVRGRRRVRRDRARTRRSRNDRGILAGRPARGVERAAVRDRSLCGDRAVSSASRGFRRPVMPALAELVLRLPNRFHWWNPIVRERQMPAHGYPRYATHAIAHALSHRADLAGRSGFAGHAAQHVVLVVNARESAVNNRAVRRLYARWQAHRAAAWNCSRSTASRCRTISSSRCGAAIWRTVSTRRSWRRSILKSE